MSVLLVHVSMATARMGSTSMTVTAMLAMLESSVRQVRSCHDYGYVGICTLYKDISCSCSVWLAGPECCHSSVSLERLGLLDSGLI